MQPGITLFLLIGSLTIICSSCSSGDSDKNDTTLADALPADVAQDYAAREDLGGPQDSSSEVREPQEENLLALVDPMIGTGGLSFRLGSVFVGAARPFGLAKLGPDTKHKEWGEPGFSHCEGYWYPDTHVAGFSHLHIHGTGAPDYGSLLVQPGHGMSASKVSEEGYMLPLDHGQETNEPGYYRLVMGKPGILAELTATTRVGMHRYTFTKTDQAVIIVDPSHVIASCDVDDTQIDIDASAGTVEGWLHTGCALSGRFGGYTMYFHGRFASNPVEAGVWQDDILAEGETAIGPETGAWFRFDASPDSPIELAMAISFVDLEHARDNLEIEIGDKNFDDILGETRNTWNEHLGLARATFADDTPEDVAIQYYTSLYHAMMMPTVWSDNDGAYLSFDGTVKVADGFDFYTDFSMWDTYRNLHPLLFLLAPDRSEDMIRSLMLMAKVEGCLPRWVLANGDSGSMIGLPASIIVADGYLHGLPMHDVELMFELLVHSGGAPLAGELVPECGNEEGLAEYIQYGYHPSDIHGGSVSMTQEIAWADYCVGRAGEVLGLEKKSQEFLARSLSPFELYNEELGFFHGKDSQGNWNDDFNRFFWMDQYVEGNAWQYLWLVPHDPGGLAQVMGGVESFFLRLDEFFDETKAWENPIVPPNHYFQGNEPDIHAPFLYSALGRPASSAKWSRWIMDNEYYVDPEGLAGNDDAGTMAAWYAFATLGFYPIPCTGRYLLGSPRVKEAWVNSLGKPLHIVVEDASESKPYVAGVTWDGEPVTDPWFTIEQLRKGGEVVFTMSEQPTDFGTTSTTEPLETTYGL